jgi:hypothetical protein
LLTYILPSHPHSINTLQQPQLPHTTRILKSPSPSIISSPSKNFFKSQAHDIIMDYITEVQPFDFIIVGGRSWFFPQAFLLKFNRNQAEPQEML